MPQDEVAAFFSGFGKQQIENIRRLSRLKKHGYAENPSNAHTPAKRTKAANMKGQGVPSFLRDLIGEIFYDQINWNFFDNRAIR